MNVSPAVIASEAKQSRPKERSPRSLRSLAMTAGVFFELTKPRLTAMVILTTWLGYAFASRAIHYDAHFFHALLGSWLVASGAAALNEYLERDRDALMRRTQRRPLPEKRVTPGAGVLVRSRHQHDRHP